MISIEKPWHILNVDMTQAINPKYQHIPPKDKHWDIISYNYWNLEKIFNPDWIEYMKSISLEVSHALVFWREPRYTHASAHIDLAFTTDGRLAKSYNYAVNYCLGEDPGEMIWYDPIDSIDRNDYKFSDAGTPYIDISLDKLTEIGRHSIGNQLTLVRVDIPHNIEILKNMPRTCISIRLRTDIKDNSTPTWDDLVAYTSKHIRI